MVSAHIVPLAPAFIKPAGGEKKQYHNQGLLLETCFCANCANVTPSPYIILSVVPVFALSICDTTKWGAGTVCHQRVPPACAPGQGDLSAAAANRLPAVHRQPAPCLHPAAVWGVGAALWQSGALLSGLQLLHGALQGLRVRGVHEERLCGEGQIRALREAAGLTHAVRALDWGGLPHIPAPALKMPVCGPPSPELADSPGPPQCPGWHPYSSLLPGQIIDTFNTFYSCNRFEVLLSSCDWFVYMQGHKRMQFILQSLVLCFHMF